MSFIFELMCMGRFAKRPYKPESLARNGKLSRYLLSCLNRASRQPSLMHSLVHYIYARDLAPSG